MRSGPAAGRGRPALRCTRNGSKGAILLAEGIQHQINCRLVDMTPGQVITLLARLALLGAGITMACMVNSGVMPVAGLGLLIAAVVTRERPGRGARLAPWIAVIGSCMTVAALMCGKNSPFQVNAFFAAQAWLVAATILPYPRAHVAASLASWKILTALWMLLGAVIEIG